MVLLLLLGGFGLLGRRRETVEMACEEELTHCIHPHPPALRHAQLLTHRPFLPCVTSTIPMAPLTMKSGWLEAERAAQEDEQKLEDAEFQA